MPTVAENINEVINNDKQLYVIEASGAAMAVLLGTIDADTGAIKTAVELIDNAISGTEMQVDVKSITAGTTNIGRVSSDGITITVTPTVDTAIHASGDNVGGLMTFAAAAQVSGGGGVIKDVTIVDDESQSGVLELWLFDTTFTAGSTNDVWTPTEAELHTLVTVISTSDGTWVSGGATATTCSIEVARRYDCAATSLFGRLVTRSTQTYAAVDDVTVRLKLLQD